MGGEKKIPLFPNSVLRGSPPRGRGKVCIATGLRVSDGITPAWAGKSSNRKSVEAMARDHPRVGGEKPADYITPSDPEGSPPRGRGKVSSVSMCTRSPGITPAWAGKSILSVQRDCPLGDHPRVGGEKSSVPVSPPGLSGSPPRGRGKDYHDTTTYMMARITPAWAGKSVSGGSPSSRSRDHPRVGGEKPRYL